MSEFEEETTTGESVKAVVRGALIILGFLLFAWCSGGGAQHGEPCALDGASVYCEAK